MESDYDPFVRTLPCASDPDDLVTWCTDADHGRCRAYLAKVISVDEDDSETTDEDEKSESLLARPPLYITENVGRGERSFPPQTIVSFAKPPQDVRRGEVTTTPVFGRYPDEDTTYYFDDAVISESCGDSERRARAPGTWCRPHTTCPAPTSALPQRNRRAARRRPLRLTRLPTRVCLSSSQLRATRGAETS
ncbi:uncharacterized protein LOC123499252 [Portunus trituberculatus]|uniref:uncharacterized protein LOC123499252 n=1 Tax=Portunus trituberculatus TaxID=210409 RepID=UPI001E1CFA14|nr:uncharacterized protein LOC123499252 [Portunus trituberculatus]XP_045102976.1 uncharacterized protein LOC123499252 [Portunus trituberculatus]XP_045102978.1 uncharacterized protein LOC123499252 [Portunus trituberculatus]XP_045102979.1 uncharacterized protein LOC123499252 [Portunus trituberculatus]XP_045102980.1 uncharacterized protein LOC123499252 [Portunus trituberculatus]